MLKQVQIRNFKSIKELDIAPKRVNVFIGKPNVGKSNILEALSLFCAGYMSEGLLRPFIRMNSVQELFHRKNINNPIYINTDLGAIDLFFFAMDTYIMRIDPLKKVAGLNKDLIGTVGDVQQNFHTIYRDEPRNPSELKQLFLILGNQLTEQDISFQRDITFYSPIKRYTFTSFPTKPTSLHYPHSLSVPSGENIVTILLNQPDLLHQIATIFKEEYNLELIIKSPENILEIHIKDGMIANSIPMNLIADTLQRIIFYLTAIKSNSGSVILFEEPETHSFPPYTNMLADRIAKSNTNQFFITTHSPYLLNTLLDETPKDEIGVFITGYENHKTTLRQLTEEELTHALDYGIDLFYNYEKYLK